MAASELVKIKCVKCKGSGKVPFSVANGVCFDCDGKGYTNDTKEAIEKRELEAEAQWEKHIQSDEYKMAQLENAYDDLIGSLQHSDKATEWESNFAYSIRGRRRDRLSPKQKETTIKIAVRLLAEDKQNELRGLLGNV